MMEYPLKREKKSEVQRTERRVLVGITGASGSIYAERLIEVLYDRVDRIYVVITDSGEKVARYELPKKSAGFSMVKFLKDPALYPLVRRFKQDDLFAPIASGTSAPTHMVIIPCSMGTLARISSGFSGNLLERSADVMLKQRKPLVLMPRESPLNAIHLKNMLTMSEMGVHIVPAMPGFYLKPEKISDLVDFMVGRVVESLGIEHSLYKPWNSRLI
jgi:4-hydroxy-3-polyprenylbenzoate decarboxylase